jgi:hypothetical protein
MVVALARKLLIVLWRLTTTGEAPEVCYFARRRSPNGVAAGERNRDARTADDGPRRRQLDYGRRAAL